MAQEHADLDQLHAFSNQQTCGAVPQVVEPNPGQPGRFKKPVEGSEHVPRLQARTEPSARSSTGYGEDEASIVPIRAGLHAFLKLACAMRAKRLQTDIWQHQRPAALHRL